MLVVFMSPQITIVFMHMRNGRLDGFGYRCQVRACAKMLEFYIIYVQVIGIHPNIHISGICPLLWDVGVYKLPEGVHA